MVYLLRAVLPALLLSGCVNVNENGHQPASAHYEDVKNKDVAGVTLGKVQQYLNIGSSGADVAQLLGSPNIVTTDDKRREVWIYDVISTETVYSGSSHAYGDSEMSKKISYSLTNIGSDMLGRVGAKASGTNTSTGAVRTSQRNLNVIVKFDKDGKVRDYAYHLMRF